MPDYKMQHFVPQFYLRNFSEGKRRSINVYNIESGKAISGASLRDQCSSPYFYGKDSKIENALAILETPASAVIKEMLETRRLRPAHTQEALVLVVFIIGLLLRTKFAAEDHSRSTDALAKAMLRAKAMVTNDPDLLSVDLDNWLITPKQPILMPLQMSLEIFPLVFDLERKLIWNRSVEPFLTSDHPVILYNQYMEGYQEASCTGLALTGLQIFLPISPTLMIHFYDPEVYKVGTENSDVCEIYSEAEALKLNQLQWLSAFQNIYYSNASSAKTIEAQALRLLESNKKVAFCTVTELELEGPSGVREPWIKLSRQDFNIRLRPSFISICKSAKRLPRSKRRPKVRNEFIVNAIRDFQKEVDLGNYRQGGILKFLSDLKQWSGRRTRGDLL